MQTIEPHRSKRDRPTSQRRPGADKRSHNRLQAVGAVFLRLEGQELACAPRDVSAGGACVSLVGNNRLVPWQGAMVHVDFMRRRGLPAFSTQAFVTRASHDGSDIGLRFEARGAERDALHRFLAAAVANRRVGQSRHECTPRTTLATLFLPLF